VVLGHTVYRCAGSGLGHAAPVSVILVATACSPQRCLRAASRLTSGAQQATRSANTSAALTPPNRTSWTSSLGVPRGHTREVVQSHAGSGADKLSVGGSQSRSALNAQIAASIAPLAPNACP